MFPLMGSSHRAVSTFSSLAQSGRSTAVPSSACTRGPRATGDGVNGDELSRDDPQHDLYLNYYDSIGVDQEFYWFTLQAAPPEALHVMTAGELDEYNFATD